MLLGFIKILLYYFDKNKFIFYFLKCFIQFFFVSFFFEASYIFFFPYFFSWLCHMTCGILVLSRSGTQGHGSESVDS